MQSVSLTTQLQWVVQEMSFAVVARHRLCSYFYDYSVALQQQFNVEVNWVERQAAIIA